MTDLCGSKVTQYVSEGIVVTTTRDGSDFPVLFFGECRSSQKRNTDGQRKKAFEPPTPSLSISKWWFLQ